MSDIYYAKNTLGELQPCGILQPPKRGLLPPLPVWLNPGHKRHPARDLFGRCLPAMDISKVSLGTCSWN